MTSPLRRLMNVIAGSTNISNVSTDGECAWKRYGGEHDGRVTHEGDLVLDLHDLDGYEAFLEEDVLAEWAEAVDFNLDGIDPLTAYYALATNVLRPYFEDLMEEHAFSSPADALATGEDFRISVNRDYIVSLLVDIFDGPFDEEVDFFTSIAIRLGPNATWADN